MTDGPQTRQRPRLLIVDDDLTIRETLEIALAPSFEVRSTAAGDEVSSIIEAFHPRLIVLDINLPGTDGFQISERIRKVGSSHRLPILFMTVRRDDRTFLAALAAGGDGVITKPFEIPELKRRIVDLLRSAER